MASFQGLDLIWTLHYPVTYLQCILWLKADVLVSSNWLLLPPPFIDTDIFVDVVARDWFGKSEHERLCMHLSCFENKSQIRWIRSRLKFLVVAESSTTLLHIFTLLVVPWILYGAIITFVVEDNHVGLVVALRKFKNSILNFVVGYSVKRPTGIQYKILLLNILLLNILLWIVCWDICTLTSETFCYEIFCRWAFCIFGILLWMLWNTLSMNILYSWDFVAKYSTDEHSGTQQVLL